MWEKFVLRPQKRIDLPLKGEWIVYVFYGNRKIHAAVYSACCFCKSEGDQCAYRLIHCLGACLCVCESLVVCSFLHVYIFFLLFPAFFPPFNVCVPDSCRCSCLHLCYWMCANRHPVVFSCVCACVCLSFQPSSRVIPVLTTCLSLSYREHE